MSKQRGMTLISLLIVGALVAGCLVLVLKVVPVYTEYFAVKSAFTKVLTSTDSSAPPSQFRAAFLRYAEIDNITSVDPQTISVNQEGGAVSMQVSYRREVPVAAHIGLYFDFDVSSN